MIVSGSTTSRATNRGGELEVRKALRDASTGAWTQSLRAEVDEQGHFTEGDEFLYRVEVISHTGMPAVEIVPIHDILPAGVDFVGFVNTANLATGTINTQWDGSAATTLDMGNNVEARWVEADRRIDIVNRTGTKMASGTISILNFKVRVNTPINPDIPIVNTAGGSTATLIPSEDYPLSIAKLDATAPTTAISDPDSRASRCAVLTARW